MLILKDPIKLNSCHPFVMTSEAFPRRLIGNYLLGEAEFTPRDMFFLLSATPDQPEEESGMTTIVSNSQIIGNSSITMEIVNNLINRILLLDSPNFTYQDEVFITTALGKMGISDVFQFVTQAREVLRESNSIKTLLKGYRETGIAMKAVERDNPKSQTTKSTRVKPTEDNPQSAVPRYYLQQEIYNRLQTEQIYNSMSKYASNGISFSETALHQSLLFAEQLRIGSLMELNKERQEVVHDLLPLTLTQIGNLYERGDELSPIKNEKDVYIQSAAAALLSAVQHLSIQHFISNMQKDNVWVDMEQSLSQTVENSFRRFEMYHSDSDWVNIQNRLQGEQNTLLGETRLFTEQLNISANQTTLETADIIQRVELLQTTTEQQPSEEKTSSTIIKRQSQTLPPSPADTIVLVEKLRQLDEQKRKQQDLIYIESIPQNLREQKTQNIILQAAEQPLQPLEEQAVSLAVQQLLLQPDDNKTLIEQLNQIDDQNRKRLEELSQITPALEIKRTASGADMPRTRQDALRAMQNQEQVLHEILSNESLQQEERPRFTPEIELLLDKADEPTRALIETVMLREHGILASNGEAGNLRQGNLGMLNAEGLRQQEEMQELIYSGQVAYEAQSTPSEMILQESVQLTKRLAQTAVSLTETQTQYTRSLLNLVHKAETSQTNDEQVLKSNTHNKIESQQTSVINEVNTQRTTQINEASQQLVAQSTEDITELVQRTIAKQMNAISGKVYQQMEKKLELERHRRGR